MSAEETRGQIPDHDRRKILTALMTAAALTMPAAKVLLARKVDYGGAGS